MRAKLSNYCSTYVRAQDLGSRVYDPRVYGEDEARAREIQVDY